jgi:hypothetical protein
MDILKVGVLAIILQGVGHAEFLEIVGAPPPSIKQICEGIVERGNVVWEYLEEMKKPGNCNAFEFSSDGWYVANNMDNALYHVINHSSILPFLRYSYNGGSITEVELSFNKNLNVPNNILQKALTLPAKIKHITMPMKKLPNPIPKQWKKRLNSLSAYNLKHINGGAFKGTSFYDDYSRWDVYDYHYISSLNLPSIESIGNKAFNYDLGLRFITFPDTLKFVGNESFYYTYIPITNIPHFTHFLSGQAFYCYYDYSPYLGSLSISDSLRFNSNVFERNCPETITITCYGRTNNLKGILKEINDSNINKSFLKNFNINMSNSIKDVVNVDYIKDIITMAQTVPPLEKIKERCFLDFSNTKITETEIQSLDPASIDNSIPWVLSFPHITTVNSNFNDLFKKLKGVILSDAKTIEAGAFADCKDTAKTLGFIDTNASYGSNFS